MNLKDVFSQLKTIEPRQEFTDYSRRLILSSAPNQHSLLAKAKNILVDTFRMGTAIALASALVLFIINATFLWKVLPSPHVAVLDPVGLRAEAQAIDIQIQLASLNFGDLTVDSSTVSTSPTAQVLAGGLSSAPAVNQPPAETQTETNNTADVETPASSSVSIDGALEELGK